MKKKREHGIKQEEKLKISLNQLSDKTILILIAVLSFIVILPLFSTLKYPFQFDDYPTIFEDTSVDGISDIFHIKLADRPVRKLSLIIDNVLFGSNVVFYRLENIFLYFISLFLTGIIVMQLTKNRLYALFSVILFGLHPIHMENILIITHRKELFLYIFSMLSFIFHIKGKKIFAIVFFLIALLSKEVAVILPFIFIVFDKIFNRDLSKKYYMTYASIFVAGILAVTLFSSITGFYLPSSSNIEEYFSINRMLRGATYIDILKIQPLIFASYIKNLLLPLLLNVDYYVPVQEAIGLMWYASLFVTVLYFILMFIFRKDRFVFFGMLFFVISYIPISNVIPVLNLIADRYMFFPSFALIIIFYRIYNSLRKSTYILAAVAVFYLIISLTYSPVFKNEISLWSYVVKKNPKSVIGNNNLGLYYMESGNTGSAEKYLMNSYLLDTLYTNSMINLGSLYARAKVYDRAIYFLKKAKTIEYDNARALYNLGLVYMNTGDMDLAIEQFREIVRYSPESSLAYNNLGAANYQYGIANEKCAEIVLSGMLYGLTPFFLGSAAEDYLDAKEMFEKGYYLDPQYEKLKNNVARINGKINGE